MSKEEIVNQLEKEIADYFRGRSDAKKGIGNYKDIKNEPYQIGQSDFINDSFSDDEI